MKKIRYLQGFVLFLMLSVLFLPATPSLALAKSQTAPLNLPIGLLLRSNQMIDYFNARLLPGDVVLKVTSGNSKDLQPLTKIRVAQKMIGFPKTYSGDPSKILAEAKSKGILMVGYDLEGSLTVQEKVKRERQLYQAARRQGLTFMFNPGHRDLERNYKSYAPYTNAFLFGSQGYQHLDNYAQIVAQKVAQFKQAKPGIQVWVQVSVNPPGDPNRSAQKVLADIQAIAPVADGIFIYYNPERWAVVQAILNEIRPPR